jgi:uncharacterized repeat protein (TIGR01451 family)
LQKSHGVNINWYGNNIHFKVEGMKRNLVSFFLTLCLVVNLYGQIISAGTQHSMVVCSDSSISAWGNNANGELGNGTIGGPNCNCIPLAGHVSNITNVVSISNGNATSFAIRNDGKVWAWGYNAYGQLGVGGTTNKTIPTPVLNLTNVIQVAAGNGFTLALKSDSTVWAWGNNVNGQVGDGTTTNRSVPVQVSSLSGVISIGAGYLHCLAAKSDGTVWAWGYNFHGELGHGDSTTSACQCYSTPVQVAVLSGIRKVVAGNQFSLAMDSLGNLWSWGSNIAGQLGNGTPNYVYTPALVINGNGIKDIYVGCTSAHCFAVKQDGNIWCWGANNYGQLGDGTYAQRNIPAPYNSFTGISQIALGSVHTLFLRNDGSVWGCGYNTYGQIGDGSTTNSPALLHAPYVCYANPPLSNYPHYVQGTLYNDSSNNCLKETAERTIQNVPINVQPGNYFAFAGDSGKYVFGIDDSITYTINPIIPQYLSSQITNPCPLSYSIYQASNSAHDTSGFDFGYDVSACWQLRVEISESRKRRCFLNHMSLLYVNEGLIAADSVKIHVKFDQYDIPVAASMTFTVDGSDSSIVFDIGTLQSYQTGSIFITDSVACISNITGLTQCTKAWILPANDCLIDSTTGPGWDHSSMAVTGECVNDTCRFVIRNNGTGDMAVPQQYRIYADNVLVYTGSYQLVSGDSLVVLWVSGGATIRLEADQHPDHPGNSHPRYTLEACGTDGSGNYSIGEVNRAPMDDEDVDVEIDCMQIRDSYDPNEKDNAPEGVEWAHYVLPNTPIDFTVHFQNTGTDTAYKVVVMDSLSNDLDLATLELGAASHPYIVSLSGQGVAVLKFTFNNIDLTDSTTDELNSHGFVKYKISPKASTPLGTRINNSADIYFDYNFPVRTNTAFVTLGNYLVLGAGGGGGGAAGALHSFPKYKKKNNK